MLAPSFSVQLGFTDLIRAHKIVLCQKTRCSPSKIVFSHFWVRSDPKSTICHIKSSIWAHFSPKNWKKRFWKGYTWFSNKLHFFELKWGQCNIIQQKKWVQAYSGHTPLIPPTSNDLWRGGGRQNHLTPKANSSFASLHRFTAISLIIHEPTCDFFHF